MDDRGYMPWHNNLVTFHPCEKQNWRATGWSTETVRMPEELRDWWYKTGRFVENKDQISEKENIRMLYQIYVWDQKEERLVADCYVTASNENDAKIAGVHKLAEFITGNIKEYDVVSHPLGYVRELEEV
jgi:hypothetical protein